MTIRELMIKLLALPGETMNSILTDENGREVTDICFKVNDKKPKYDVWITIEEDN